MNGMKPSFLNEQDLTSAYYSQPDPYKAAPSCNVNLLEASRYAKSIGKKISELTKEEIKQFTI